MILMCYANVVLARGVERFADELEQANVSGLIIPDLPLEEAPAALAACDAAGIALVPLVAPTTPEDRLARIGAQARGFVYTVSVTGTTGERGDVDSTELLARVKAHTEVPVALGFGISTPAQAAAAAAAGADGVIVGSRLVRAAAEGEDVRALVEGLATALARRRRVRSRRDGALPHHLRRPGPLDHPVGDRRQAVRRLPADAPDDHRRGHAADRHAVPAGQPPEPRRALLAGSAARTGR